MEDLREQVYSQLSEAETERVRIHRKLRRLTKELSRVSRRISDSYSAIHVLDFLLAREFDMRCLERLGAQDLIDVFTQAYAYTYFDVDTEEQIASSWVWRCKWAKEIAYEEIGKRRLTKKHRTKEMISRVMSIHARRLGFRFYNSDGHHQCMTFPRLSCFMDLRDSETISSLLSKIEEYGKKKTYEQFNRKRILLAGWRLRKRMTEKDLRGN